MRNDYALELLECLKDVVDNLMIDFPENHKQKSRYSHAIALATRSERIERIEKKRDEKHYSRNRNRN